MLKPKKNSKDVRLDLRYTPPYAVFPLMELLKLTEKHCVWESANGQGDLSRAMKQLSKASIFASDLPTGHDFFNPLIVPQEFKDDRLKELTGIITNPPYSIKPQWLTRCFEVSKNVALLLPVESIASIKLQSIWSVNGGVSMLLPDSRIDFKADDKKWHESSAQFPSAWFITGFGIEAGRIINCSIQAQKKIFKKNSRIKNL